MSVCHSAMAIYDLVCQCEKPKGHTGVHSYLDGDWEWNDDEARQWHEWRILRGWCSSTFRAGDGRTYICSQMGGHNYWHSTKFPPNVWWDDRQE